LLGVGLGGFVDGIVLHQILQWHHMLSNEGGYPTSTVGGLKDNTVADGLFHAVAWLAIALGLIVLWRRSTDWRSALSGRALLGWMLLGWGLFNLLEGLVDHHVLGIHHVREDGDETTWDLAFLALGALLVVAGGRLIARARPARVS
jgi:uncharacterized membrane protein